jgi:hypothetical protein
MRGINGHQFFLASPPPSWRFPSRHIDVDHGVGAMALITPEEYENAAPGRHHSWAI